MKECIEGKEGGRSLSWRELAMHGDLDVIASVRCVVNSNVVHFVLCKVACVLKEMIWSTEQLVGGPISSPMSLNIIKDMRESPIVIKQNRLCTQICSPSNPHNAGETWGTRNPVIQILSFYSL